MSELPETITMSIELPCEEFVREYVDTERFLACCKECRNYGLKWSCPPYDFDPNDIWRSFNTVLIYAKKVLLPKEETEKLRTPKELAEVYESLLRPVRNVMASELIKMEGEDPNSLALFAGGCDICAECTRPMGLPCRAPSVMRYSVESLGGNVIKCVNELLHEEILWAENGRLPKHYVLLGALLKK